MRYLFIYLLLICVFVFNFISSYVAFKVLYSWDGLDWMMLWLITWKHACYGYFILQH